MKKINQKSEITNEVINKSMPIDKYLPWGLLALILLAGLGAYLKWGNAATVNGQPISRLAYYQTLEEQDKKQTLERMIEETLIQSEAAKKGIKVEQGSIDEEIKKIEERLKEQGQTLDGALSMQGMSREELDRQIKIQKMIEELSKPKKEFSQEEIDGFLKENKELLPTGTAKKELEDLAKEQLASQELNKAIGDWLTNTKKDAKIIYN